MFCLNCGTSIGGDAEFCDNCADDPVTEQSVQAIQEEVEDRSKQQKERCPACNQFVDIVDETNCPACGAAIIRTPAS